MAAKSDKPARKATSKSTTSKATPISAEAKVIGVIGKANAAPKAKAAAAAPETLKKAEFFTTLSAQSTLKKPDLRAAVDLTLAEIAKALAEGRDLVLPPLGKISLKNAAAARAAGKPLTAKIRLTPSGEAQKAKPLAEPDEDE